MPAGAPFATSRENEDALRRLCELLPPRDIQAIIQALQIPLETGSGFGFVEIEIWDGHVRVARGTVSIKP